MRTKSKTKLRIFIVALTLFLTLGVCLDVYVQYYVDSVLKWESIQGMPRGYTDECVTKGTIQTVSYQSESNGKMVKKSATVYLPYDYGGAKDRKYDVIYLMHGRGGSYQTWLGTAKHPRPFKNLLDNMIYHGDMKSVILVAPNLAYEFGKDDDVMDGTASEIVNTLIPIIDRKYSTYGTRKHRCMAGFSMGGSLTWHMLKDHADCFYYYVPMSMALYYDDNGYSMKKSLKASSEIIKNLSRRGYDSDDFRVYAATGTDDFKVEALYMQVSDLLEEGNTFEFTYDSYKNGNIMLKVWPYHWHRYTQAFPYLYNAFKIFFKP